MANVAVENLKLLNEQEVKKVLMLVEENVDKTLILDYSTISYIFAKRGWFVDLQTMNNGYFMTVASHNCIPILGLGLVYFQAFLGNTYYNVILSKQWSYCRD